MDEHQGIIKTCALNLANTNFPDPLPKIARTEPERFG